MRTAPRWGAAAMLALAAGLGQGGCSVSRAPLPPGVLATDAAASAAQELARLDAAQRQSGKAPAELPAALDLPALHAPEPLPPGATVDLAGALEAVRGVVAERRNGAGDAGAAPVDAAAQETALRHYVAGRLELEAGRYREAIEKLRAGVRLDPSSASLWEALGEAQQRSGLARPAAESFARAAALGSVSPAALLPLARSAQREGRHAEAAGWLATLAGDAGAMEDAALSAAVHTMLGESLIEAGYLAAGAAALERGLDLPRSFTGPTPYSEELGEVLRRRSDLWRLAGDTLCRVGRYESALSAYEEAGKHPSLDAAGLLPRRVYAAVRLGRPARAAMAIHEEVTREDGARRLEESHVALIRALAAHDPKTGEALGTAILAQREVLGAELADSLRGRLTRAGAAALGADQAAAVLRERLAENPLDSATLAALLALTPEGDATGAAAALAELVERAPMHADTIAETVTRPGARSVDELESALEGQRRAGARMLLAGIKSRTGDAAGAAALVERLREGRGEKDIAVGSLAAAVGARLGRWDLALPALAVLEADQGTPRAVLARALAAAQRFEPALDALDAALNEGGKGASAEDMLLGAEIAASLGRVADQERYLLAAMDADPYNERAHVPLLRLYAPGGSLEDRTKLTEMVRRVREAAPSSRALRLMRAEELMMVGRVALGQRELLALAEEDPYNPAPLRSLVTGWLRPGQENNGAAFDAAAPALEAMIAAHGDADWPVATRAILAAIRGDEETVARLAEGRAPLRTPGAAAVLEDALRRVGRVEEADAMTAARLGAAPPNIANAAELAAVLARGGNLAEAERVLRERVPEGAVLTPGQAAPLLLAVEVAAARGAAGAEAGAALMDRVVGLVGRAPLGLHALRIAYLAAAAEPSVDAVLAAAERAAEQHPGDVEEVYHLAASRLAERDPRAALDLLARAVVRAGDGADPALYRQWVRWAVQVGTPADASAAVRAAIEARMTPFILPPDPDDPAAGPPTPAELAYQLGVVAASLGEGRDETAIALYEIALEHEPGHGWACNNLGYTLLERDGPVERAAQLLEAAYAALPNEASVIDSLGWLRYKQGMLDDETDGEGNVVRQGALSLLFRASGLVGEDNPVITDHLGDALWAMGDGQGAVAHWRMAEQQARRQIRLIERSGLGESGALASLRARLRALERAARGKQLSAERGQPPAVAPIPGREVPELGPVKPGGEPHDA